MPHTVDVMLSQSELSADQLAEAAGISPARIAAIVDGRWTPSPEERAKIATAFGVPVGSISWGHTMNPRNVRYHRFGTPTPDDSREVEQAE